MRSVHLTRFVSRHVAGSRADSLCFGDPVRRQISRNGNVSYCFRPCQLFAVVWWRHCSPNRQHRTLAILEALPPAKVGCVLPGIHPGVAVHVLVRQHGPAGQDEAVDCLLDLIGELKNRGINPANMPVSFWIEAAQQILLYQRPLESFDVEGIACRASR